MLYFSSISSFALLLCCCCDNICHPEYGDDVAEEHSELRRNILEVEYVDERPHLVVGHHQGNEVARNGLVNVIKRASFHGADDIEVEEVVKRTER